MKELVEGIDYYINDGGLIVLTSKYHLERGYCCGQGCKHCPFNYEAVHEPRKTNLLREKESNKRNI